MHRKSRKLSYLLGLIVIPVLKSETIVSVTFNLIMLFMRLRGNCMMSLAFSLSFNMQRLYKIELEM